MANYIVIPENFPKNSWIRSTAYFVTRNPGFPGGVAGYRAFLQTATFTNRRDSVDNENIYLQTEDGIKVKVPKVSVREEKDFQVGDIVYLFPDYMTGRANVGVHPIMEEFAGSRAIIGGTSVKMVQGFEHTLYSIFLKDRRFLYESRWLSFLPANAGKPVKKEKDLSKEVERLISKAISRRKEFRYPLQDGTARASYASVFKLRNGEDLHLTNHTSDVCHARLLAEGEYVTVAVIDFINHHIDRGAKGKPFYRKNEEFVSAFGEYFDWWANRGPLSRVILTKDIFEAVENGIRYDCSYSPSAIATAAIGLRQGGEFNEIPYAFQKLKEVFKEDIAGFFSMLFQYDSEDKLWFMEFKGWHDILSSALTLNVLKSWHKDGNFPMFNAGQAKANEVAKRYAIYEGIGHQEAPGSSVKKVIVEGEHKSIDGVIKKLISQPELKEYLK